MSAFNSPIQSDALCNCCYWHCHDRYACANDSCLGFVALYGYHIDFLISTLPRFWYPTCLPTQNKTQTSFVTPSTAVTLSSSTQLSCFLPLRMLFDMGFLCQCFHYLAYSFSLHRSFREVLVFTTVQPVFDESFSQIESEREQWNTFQEHEPILMS